MRRWDRDETATLGLNLQEIRFAVIWRHSKTPTEALLCWLIRPQPPLQGIRDPRKTNPPITINIGDREGRVLDAGFFRSARWWLKNPPEFHIREDRITIFTALRSQNCHQNSQTTTLSNTRQSFLGRIAISEGKLLKTLFIFRGIASFYQCFFKTFDHISHHYVYYTIIKSCFFILAFFF